MLGDSTTLPQTHQSAGQGHTLSPFHTTLDAFGASISATPAAKFDKLNPVHIRHCPNHQQTADHAVHTRGYNAPSTTPTRQPAPTGIITELPTRLAGGVADSQPFHSPDNLLQKVNWPIAPWPIRFLELFCSLVLSLPRRPVVIRSFTVTN